MKDKVAKPDEEWRKQLTPEQYRAEPECILHGTRHLARLADLAVSLVEPPARGPTTTTLFLSHGLAGTEVAVAATALENARRLGIGTSVAWRGS